jgi:hypothetical protein
MAFEMVESKKKDSLRRERERELGGFRKKKKLTRERPFWKTQRRKRGARLNGEGGRAALEQCLVAALRACEGRGVHVHQGEYHGTTTVG